MALESGGLGGLDFRGRDAINISAAVSDGINFAAVDVESCHTDALFAIEQCEREPDIAKADNADAGLFGGDFLLKFGGKGDCIKNCHIQSTYKNFITGKFSLDNGRLR